MKAAVLLAFLILTSATSARAEAPKVAVFDFELIDTSLQGEVQGPRQDEQARLTHAAEQLRSALQESGRFRVLDIAPVNDAAHHSNLQACGGCDVKLAGDIGADLAITGTVQKVSNLILNMNIYLRDARTGKPVAAMTADMRGNTDESWTRTMAWLIRNRLLAPNYGAPQAQ
ncbi:DUF3280 domain-containing protein [Bradyrhizobium sp. 83012]|uniref:DUF3280 domain-containing protein n=1 Tax=Bradyrhizobium aeschynomenes TaxID=2734909 RepID=A0ABX2CP52_9BRAD|nr:DUF3280 domain-containing protein [Bradyrhizobium aeschynomenes]NPU11664.1 DUF3280 domain-containing protein [Bradyrhizobium aeschynomenes]NPU69129.1 DUF3280 domain-containing protein [Bradyrhizobium aeschynomenes]NPV23883.1 DUF3280 domain-containing protein [Bradyrhizobium aeschynomenes]